MNNQKIIKKIIENENYDYICINIETEEINPCFQNSQLGSKEIMIEGVSDIDVYDYIYDMINTLQVSELAYNNWSRGFADGVVQFNYEDENIYGATMTQGTVENPENPVFEIYRISQNTDFENNENEDGCIAEIEEELYAVLEENIRDNCPDSYLNEIKESLLLDRIERALDALTEINLRKEEIVRNLKL